ncbi:energy-coupling factor transporter transmembrane component T family protein [Fructilactobacillus florum]|uniref:energy-coupling factor transporter transmembrane component T family protein n=1 Tax=Fructilactobacillus florum TaxID=640331 RepID=UPI000A970E7E|nr:energy-coupling factor transporter transmembrane protein EcfT [Fructilactobacillus florum]
MQQIVFGNYLPGNSLIHRLNPVTKILAVLLLITWTLVANNWLNYGILGCALIVQISAARLSLSMMLHTIIPFLWLIGFTLLIQILFGTGGTIYFHWGVVKITSTGLVTAGLILVRFTLIIMEAALLTMTTSPNAIAAGIERLLQPLKRLKVPVSTIDDDFNCPALYSHAIDRTANDYGCTTLPWH